MQFYTNVELKITENNSFKGDDGTDVKYHTNFLKDADGSVMEVTGTRDFSGFEGKRGLAVLRARKRDGGGFRLSLVDFQPEVSIEVPTIAF